LTEFVAAAVVVVVADVVVAGATDAAAVGLGVDVGVEDPDRDITNPDCSNIRAELSQELLSCDASQASCPVTRDDPFWA
jgi:hypothetical protein